MTDKEKLTAIKENVLARYKSNTEYENNTSGGRFYAAKADEDRELLSFIDSMQKEPISEDLEKASIKYAQDKYMPVQTSQAFKAGAQWQKQQMMKDAVDGYVTLTLSGKVSVGALVPQDKYKFDDKVKVIIFKED